MMKNIFLLIALSFSGVLFAQHDYAKAQHLSTYYLGDQRCGDTDSWIHGACHLEDGLDVGLDLTGGWHDCGDYIKFGQTSPYTAIVLLMGYENYPEAYPDNYSQALSAPPGNGIPDILDEIKIETDFLIKTINNGTVYYQVGDSTDHGSFHDPVYQSNNIPQSEGGNPRNSYSITSGGSNVCGDAAAALALMSIVYQPYDATYAASCLVAAQEYYQVGQLSSQAIPSTSNNSNEFYKKGNWADDMALGAIELYKATGNTTYLTESEGYYNNSDFAVADWQPLITEYVNQLVNVELYKETSTALYLSALQSHLDEMYLHPNTCGYMDFSSWGSLYYAADAAFIASVYHQITGDVTAYTFAKGQVDFILGSHGNISADAPVNHSFLIGYVLS